MKILLACTFLFLNMIPGSKWKPGKVDSDGSLIIVEMENKPGCNGKKQHETIVVDMDWSILLRSDSETLTSYFIFDNSSKKVYSTRSFGEFIFELKKIPSNTTIRQIERCTMPFSYLVPENQFDKIKVIFESKECTLEERLMYCWCCAHKLDYAF